MPVSPRPHVPTPLGARPPAGSRRPEALGPPMHALAAQVRYADPTAVRAVLEPLREAFARHRAVTEGVEGSYADVVADAPRLARTVDALVAEHLWIEAAMAHLALTAAAGSAADALRREAREVLAELIRHGEHDSDLVHEAYATDIGGE